MRTDVRGRVFAARLIMHN